MENTIATGELYASYKTLLFTLAYRMLGSVMDAEDIVHEAFIALQGVDADHVANPKAYLCKIVTNRCLDRLRSAQKQREVYVGPWLPEPIVTSLPGESGSGDPYQAYVRQESVSTAYLLLLQQLSWVERTVFLLREVLQFDYEEIAEITGKSSQNCRQIFHRAKRAIHHPADDQQAPAPGGPGQLALVEQFTAALLSGDIGKLLNVLSLDATLVSDGGGKVSAAVRPILGPSRIAGFFDGLLKKLPPDFSFRLAAVGRQPGLVTYVGGIAASVFSFRFEQERIAEIYVVVNPDKLAGVQ